MKATIGSIGPPVLPRGVSSDTVPDWRVRALLSLWVLIGSFFPGSVVAQNHSQIFFDVSGADQAFFGPNDPA